MTNSTSPTISLDALQSGDPAAFATLMEQYSGMIYRLGLKMLNNPQAAEDILQETFIKAFQNITKFDGRSKIGTWLYRIAVNESLMVLRRKQPELLEIDRPPANKELLDAPQQIVDWCCLPEEEFLSAETRQVLEDAISQLNPGNRSVFILRDIEGLSSKETAEVMQISEGAVRTRLLRARLQLREILSAYFGEKIPQD